MNGPEHYRAAETALANASECDVEYVQLQNYWLARAQVHATLALAAAAAVGMDGNVRHSWREVME
jgi:hypothetical protein